jgi:lysophospholipase L1-like esterase
MRALTLALHVQFNWIIELQRRLGQRRFVFRNFGVGGDLAYNALQRLSGVIASCPKKIVVLIGGNDVLALVSTTARRFFRLSKRLPRDRRLSGSVKIFRQSHHPRRLRPRTPLRSVRCRQSEKTQCLLNRRIEEFSVIIRGIAQEERTDYIALHEAMSAQVRKSPGRAFTEFGFLSFIAMLSALWCCAKAPTKSPGSMVGAFTPTAFISIAEVY